MTHEKLQEAFYIKSKLDILHEARKLISTGQFKSFYEAVDKLTAGVEFADIREKVLGIINDRIRSLNDELENI